MRGCLVAALLSLTACASAPERTATDEALEDLGKERCEAAVEGLNRGLKAGDPQAYYWTGALLHYGVCLKADPGRAVPYLELAAKHRIAKAARLLVLTHGLGRGVPQSYVEAGRWTQASHDIHEIVATKQDLSAEDKAERVDLSEWALLGVAGTLWMMLPDKVSHPNIQSFRYRGVDRGGATVTLVIGPSGLSYRLSNVSADGESQDTTRRRTSEAAFRSQIEAGLDAALRELPPFELPAKRMAIGGRVTFQ
jgi:hypothetical protein